MGTVNALLRRSAGQTAQQPRHFRTPPSCAGQTSRCDSDTAFLSVSIIATERAAFKDLSVSGSQRIPPHLRVTSLQDPPLGPSFHYFWCTTSTNPYGRPAVHFLLASKAGSGIAAGSARNGWPDCLGIAGSIFRKSAVPCRRAQPHPRLLAHGRADHAGLRSPQGVARRAWWPSGGAVAGVPGASGVGRGQVPCS